VDKLVVRLRELGNRILEWWNRFTVKQKTLLICGMAVVIVAIVAVVTMVTKPQYVLLRECETAAEASEKLPEFIKHVSVWFMPTDLMHLRRGGRVSGASAVIGTALRIKPILLINKDGGLSVMQKELGATKGLNAMTDIFKKRVAKATHKVYIASADSDLAETLKEKIKAVRPDCEVVIGWIGPVIGAHTGCNAVGVSFLSDDIRKQ